MVAGVGINGLPIPTHVLWGELDRAVSVDAVHVMMGLLPNSDRTLMPGIGHLPMLEAQQRVMGDAEFWDLKPILLPGDAAAVRSRRALGKGGVCNGRAGAGNLQDALNLIPYLRDLGVDERRAGDRDQVGRRRAEPAHRPRR